TCIVVATV
ncbi:aminotransferase class-V family protein, partial [Vibrio parahaemolyticus V-223/04]